MYWLSAQRPEEGQGSIGRSRESEPSLRASCGPRASWNTCEYLHATLDLAARHSDTTSAFRRDGWRRLSRLASRLPRPILGTYYALCTMNFEGPTYLYTTYVHRCIEQGAPHEGLGILVDRPRPTRALPDHVRCPCPRRVSSPLTLIHPGDRPAAGWAILRRRCISSPKVLASSVLSFPVRPCVRRPRPSRA